MDVSLNANVITMQTVLPQNFAIADWKKIVKMMIKDDRLM